MKRRLVKALAICATLAIACIIAFHLAVAFLPYLFHIAFHNDGPFQADFLFWYVIAIGAVLNSQSAREYQLPVSSESEARI